ncbi:hypothetical protein EV359DRAFT_46360 [Lentinula novae-zelandiae]|nr:hypothetical protein EV359DRAFT_46360 [Lentinula novae-zelandiae]
MGQDSKHCLKTFHNNLFTGARLLTLGNHAAFYELIREMAFVENSPLFHCRANFDVTLLARSIPLGI